MRNAVQSLAEHEMLAEFWTTIAWDLHSPANALLPAPVRAQLARRAFPQVPSQKLRSAPWREIVRLAARPHFLRHLLTSAERPFSIIGMYRSFDRKVARRVASLHPTAVYAYEGGALHTFRAAKRLGIATIYELPSSYWYWEHQLLSREAERNPEFANLLPKLKDSPGHMRWKDEELALADRVIVPSAHVRETLAGVVPPEKISVVSYGAPPLHPRPVRAADPNAPLKVLFVGALIQRKGIGYLLDAVDALGPRIALTLVGQRFAPNRRVDEACNRGNWFPSLPHEEVLDAMSQADVLVLPSLTEAFGLVVLEAIACGLPVVVTPNTGSTEFVRDGENGFIVPIADSRAIVDCLDMLDRDRDLLASMSQNAHKLAERHSWQNYRIQLADTLRQAA